MNSLRRHPRAKAAATTLLVVALLAVTGLVAYILIADNDETTPAPKETLRVAIIGDSYSAGLKNTIVWPTLMAESTGASVSNVSLPASGYLADAGGLGPFAAQSEKALASKPDVIVVFGGLFDIGRPLDLIGQAVSDLVANLARSAPNAKIIVVGPLWHEIPAPEAVRQIDETVGTAVRNLKLPYLSVVDEPWLAKPGLFRNDDSQPTDTGQRVLANSLTDALRAGGVPFG